MVEKYTKRIICCDILKLYGLQVLLSIKVLVEYNHILWGHLGGLVVKCLPLAQGVILETQERVPHRAPCMEPILPLPVSLPLSLCLS